MANLKTYLDHKNTPAITLFVFILAASAAVGILAYYYNEARMPHAVLFGGLCSWVSMASMMIFFSKIKLTE